MKPCCAAHPEPCFAREATEATGSSCSARISFVCLRFEPIYTLLQCQFIPLEKLSLAAERDGARLILLIRLMVETRRMQTQGSKQKRGKYCVYSFERGAGVRGWLVNQSVLVPVMNATITCPPSGDCSESLSYFIFQGLGGGGRQISAVNLSLEVGGSCADGLALLT